jgi:hypothetical protein
MVSSRARMVDPELMVCDCQRSRKPTESEMMFRVNAHGLGMTRADLLMGYD